MKRRDFFKNVGIIGAGIVIPHKKLISFFSEEEARKIKKNTPSQKEKESRASTLYLTFDDAPRGYTNEIMSVLKPDGKATFFVIGSQMKKKYRKDILSAIEQGHLIGNHSYSHPHFSGLSLEKAKEEITKTQESIYSAVKEVLGEREADKYKKVFRFPFRDEGQIQNLGGSEEKKKEIKKAIEEMGYKIYDWNVDTQDWRFYSKNPLTEEEIIRNFEKGKISGKIILLHESENTAQKILPKITEICKGQFQFKTL